LAIWLKVLSKRLAFEEALLGFYVFWGFGQNWPFLTFFDKISLFGPKFWPSDPILDLILDPKPGFWSLKPHFWGKRGKIGGFGPWFWSWFGQTLKIGVWNLGLDPFQTDFGLSDRFLDLKMAGKWWLKLKIREIDHFCKMKMKRPKKPMDLKENGNYFQFIWKID
jgi:hypothetical protein